MDTQWAYKFNEKFYVIIMNYWRESGHIGWILVHVVIFLSLYDCNLVVAGLV